MTIPYGFQHIDAAQAVHDTPLWRDGNSKETRYSGELLITLNALTPLIVGNHQHKVDKKHSLLVPQMLDDGRVLLPGSSLKGMLRGALAALLHAPMERVAEHHYTYRPNLDFGTKRETRAAVITHIEGQGDSAKITIALLSADSPVVFVRADAFHNLGNPQQGAHIQRQCHHVELTGKAPRMRLEAKNNEAATLDHRVFLYRGGMDGEGHLAEAFNNGMIYRYVLVPTDHYAKAKELSIPNETIFGYWTSQTILADDQFGHLSPGHTLASKLHPGTKAAILKNSSLQVNQLIYVEIEGLASAPRIVSMGHHFQYRWGHTSSVRYKNRLLDGKGVLRPELGLHPQEQATADGAPQQLTGARLLFGYAVNGQNDEQRALATGNFKRLAGRIAFNTAIEEIDGKSTQERFMNEGKEIQLQILGMPRSSAVEFYLKQTTLHKNLLTTYGDLSNEPGGDLAGRKFYRHQPDARQDSSTYTFGRLAQGQSGRAAERGPCVRYLSKQGSRFRCTLRFDSLRPWELGALLVALDPKQLEPLFDIQRHRLGYAHKLGYGKPLGLGSVRLSLDGARWQENDEHNWQQTKTPNTDTAWGVLKQSSLDALKDKMQEAWREKAKEHLAPWLKARRWLDGGRSAYPTATNKYGETTIFNFHTDLRRKHAAARRGQNMNFNDFKKWLESDA